MKYLLLQAAAVAVAAQVCSAATVTNTTPNVVKTNGELIYGDGIPTNGFAVDNRNGASGLQQVAVKVRNRSTGQANSISGTTYFVNPGFAPGSTNRFEFQIDFQASPGASAGASTFDDLTLRLSFDDNPTAAVSYKSLDFSPNSTDSSGDGRFTNPNNGTWTANDPFIFGNSFQPQFIPGVVFTGAPGEYNVKFEVLQSNGNVVLGQEVTGVIAAVPSPTAAAGGVLLFGTSMLRRRLRA